MISSIGRRNLFVHSFEFQSGTLTVNRGGPCAEGHLRTLWAMLQTLTSSRQFPEDPDDH
jgi:hypothetical protein